MYPIIRFCATLLKARRQPRAKFADNCRISIHCMPWDIDVFMEMNNGRVLTLFDLGRIDLAVRTGLAKQLKLNQWGLVVAGCSVRYRRRIRLFEKVDMYTRVVGMDERWIYIKQSMWVGDQPASSILLRTGITKKGKTIPTQEVKDKLGISDWQPRGSEWLDAWVESETKRPWPPAR